MGQDDWSVRLEGSLLGPVQVTRVRRTAYEELLWLAADVVTRRVDHRSGQALSPPQAAREGLPHRKRRAPPQGGLSGSHTSSRQRRTPRRRPQPLSAQFDSGTLDHFVDQHARGIAAAGEVADRA
jgi:hypothetical protein